ncbi:MAG TPA: O-antigen ligase family protein [Bacteroidales bacterium]|nr:O-antigen ligase family protein [Bacteroidales bacterium]
MISSEFIIIWLIPVILAIVLLAAVSLEYLLLLALFLTPLSIQISYLTGTAPFDLSLPTEPVMAMLLFVTLFKLIVSREFSVSLLRHPVTLVIAFYLIWTLVSSVTSSIVIVSFKTLAYRMWFISGFYLIAAQLFIKDGIDRKYVTAYSAGLAIVVMYFLIRVGSVGLLNQKFAHSACYPFYGDHTSFGASLAFLLPPLTVMFFNRGKQGIRGKLLLGGLIFLFIAGFVFSYSRAAWVSLLVSLAVTFILWLRMPKRLLFLISAVLLVMFAFSAGSIWQKMDSTTEDSSADLAQHLRSSSNISTDQSNLERINRWKCALRMFAEKPLLGWGPGTYQFQYAPFQRSSERTIISTDFGDAGNSHSEYLGALSEGGLPGALLFLLLTAATIMTGIRVWYREKRSSGYFALAIMAGLMTYMIHGTMNSFLDSDKIAALWWGFIAMIVAMDVKGGRPLRNCPAGPPAGGEEPDCGEERRKSKDRAYLISTARIETSSKRSGLES